MAKTEIQKTDGTADIARVDPDSPAGIMMQLMSGGDKFDVEGFGKMLEFQERHEANQARKAYHVAMAEFQAESPKIIKQKSGHNNKYAGLSDIVAVVAPLESKHGLSHSWVTGTADKEIKVICKITHILGHSEKTELSAGPDASGNKNDIQALGSTITYLQRYTLKAALGLAEADQDDDGAGSGKGKDKVEIPEPNKKEQSAIDAICAKLPPQAGMRVDTKKVASLIFGRWQRYPGDFKWTDEGVEWLTSLGYPEIYIPENRSQAEIDLGMPGDEDSRPDTEADKTAAAKFGEENEQVELRYYCTKCDKEFEDFKIKGVCVNTDCLSRDIIDRQK